MASLKFVPEKGQWALVTGASSGIGKEFCAQLAARGVNIVMVARRENLIRTLGLDLSASHRIRTLPVPMDLIREGAVTELRAILSRQGIAIRLLVNNAGSGRWGHFAENSSSLYASMIRLNVEALVSMCREFLPDLASRSGAIINVSSPAALQPVPYMAVYAATKSFVHSFSQALHEELRHAGVLVQTLMPGPTESEFDEIAGAYASAASPRGSAGSVVSASIEGLRRGVPIVSSARGTYKQRIFAGLFPARMVLKEVAKMFEPPRERPRI